MDPHISLLVTYSHSGQDRLENLKVFMDHWLAFKNIHLHIYCHNKESKRDVQLLTKDSQKSITLEEQNTSSRFFHRTKYFNDLIKKTKTQISVVADIDCIIPISQVNSAARLIQAGAYKFALPYSDGVYEIVDKTNYKSHLGQDPESMNLQKWPSYDTKELVRWFDAVDRLPPPFNEHYSTPLGLFFMFDTKEYALLGGENENFIEWGLEDHERFDRVKKLGYEVLRVPGPCYHLFHKNRSLYAGFKTNNYFEWLKIKTMNKDELVHYISSWQWKNEF
jgi:hypothetical protein